jgi:hypothetical protein
MVHVLFIITGIAAGFHAYTYGRWLKQQGNLPGALCAFFFAAAAVVLPVAHLWLK